jgi:hypothetical protein
VITKQESDKKENLDNLSEFSELILNVIDFYSFINEGIVDEEGDSWKNGTDYGSKGVVPKDLEKKMKELFVNKANYLIELEKKKISDLKKYEK